MGFFDKLFGREPAPATYDAPPRTDQSTALQSGDEQAIARYLYLLKTAPPDDIERAHQEAFARLTLEQRRQVLQQLGKVVPHSEYSRMRDDPHSLARAATRAEISRPGTLRNAFGGAGAGAMGGGFGVPGMGAMMMGGLLSTLAGAFIGTSIAHAFFANPTNEAAFQESPEAAGEVTDEVTGEANGETGGAAESTAGDLSGAEGPASGELDAGYDASEADMDAGLDADFEAGDFGDFGGGDFGDF